MYIENMGKLTREKKKNIDTVLNNVAWYYPNPKDAAKEIKDHVAFCKWSWDLSLKQPLDIVQTHNHSG